MSVYVDDVLVPVHDNKLWDVQQFSVAVHSGDVLAVQCEALEGNPDPQIEMYIGDTHVQVY